MKAREVREQLKDHADPRVLRVIEALAEDISSMKQVVLELANMMDQQTTIIGDMVNVTGRVKSANDALRKKFGVTLESEEPTGED